MLFCYYRSLLLLDILLKLRLKRLSNLLLLLLLGVLDHTLKGGTKLRIHLGTTTKESLDALPRAGVATPLLIYGVIHLYKERSLQIRTVVEAKRSLEKV